MNVVNPLRASVADQNALITQLQAGHVRIIRCGITPDAKAIDFAKRVYARGLQIELIVSPQFPASAPSVPWRPKEFPNMWGGHPLSYADPQLSRLYYQNLLNLLDENGIQLAGIELGNEINWAAFNPEFPLPGEGRNFSLAELSHDPEAMQVAKGFLQYLKVLAVLRDVRDHSKLNRRTPLISAGLADSGPPNYHPGAKPADRKDSVSINATLDFMRAHGLDQLVDAYGIHTYPWASTAAQRKASLMQNALAECAAPHAKTGKPCWVTEWGIDNKDVSCPLDDTARAAVVQEIMNDFRDVAQQGRLAGVLYFSWDADPWSKQVSANSVYRCGALTKSGHEALQPLSH